MVQLHRGRARTTSGCRPDGVDYQAAPLGGRNGAVAGQPVTIDLNVARQEGAEPSEVVATVLWLSTDDGSSWRLVHLAKAGPGHYRAVIPGSRLRSGTWVSLAPGPATPATAASTRP